MRILVSAAFIAISSRNKMLRGNRVKIIVTMVTAVLCFVLFFRRWE